VTRGSCRSLPPRPASASSQLRAVSVATLRLRLWFAPILDPHTSHSMRVRLSTASGLAASGRPSTIPPRSVAHQPPVKPRHSWVLTPRLSAPLEMPSFLALALNVHLQLQTRWTIPCVKPLLATNYQEYMRLCALPRVRLQLPCFSLANVRSKILERVSQPDIPVNEPPMLPHLAGSPVRLHRSQLPSLLFLTVPSGSLELSRI